MNYKMRLSSVLMPVVVLSTLVMTGCADGNRDSASEKIVDLSSLMRDYRYMPESSRCDSLTRYMPEISAFMEVVSGEPLNDSLLVSWSGSPVVSVFTASVDSVYPTMEPLERDLGYILKAAEEQGLQLPRRRYAAVTYGRPEAVLFVDSVMLIALNHFLGPDFPGYSRWPVYRRQEKSPSNLPYALSEALIATRYPYEASPEQATLLSRMLYEGALAKAKLETVPDATVEGVLGYDKKDFAELTENEGELWRQIVAAGLLYDTSVMTAERLNAPSPAVTVLSSVWPPRVGRFVGYRIVDSYLKKYPETTLAQLLSPDFYNSAQTLAQSAYKP